jgi:hypothetical protein
MPDASMHFAKHTKYAHTEYSSKHAKLNEVEPNMQAFFACRIPDTSSRFLDSPL